MIKEMSNLSVVQELRREIAKPEYTSRELARNAFFEILISKYKLPSFEDRMSSEFYLSLLKFPGMTSILEYLELPNG